MSARYWVGLAFLAGALAPHVAPQQAQAPVLKPKPKPRPADATLLVMCDLACNWKLDGEAKGHIDAGGAVKAKVELGQHVVQATTEDGADQVKKLSEVKSSGQTVVSFELQPIRDARLKTTPKYESPAALTQAEAALWKNIENSNREEDYQGYLQSYPNGVYAGLASSRIEAMVWKRAEATHNPDDLRTYLSTYPKGPHAIAAANLLESLRWAETEKSTNPADFRTFIKEFPNGTRTRMAADRVEELEWKAVSQGKSPADYKAFIEAHPNGQYSTAAQKQYTELLNQENERKRQADEANAAAEDRQRNGWYFKWTHVQGNFWSVNDHYDAGNMTVSPQGLKWEETGPDSSHNFSANCPDVKFVDHGAVDGDEVVDVYVSGRKMVFEGIDGAAQFLNGFSHFCQHH